MSPLLLTRTVQAHQAALDFNDAELYNLITQIPNQEQFLANALKYLVDNFDLEAIATLTSHLAPSPGD